MRVSRLLALAFASAALFSCTGTAHEEKGGSPSLSPERKGLLKEEVHASLIKLDSAYQMANNGIYFSTNSSDYYHWPLDRDVDRPEDISDALRLSHIESGLKSPSLRSALSPGFYAKVQGLKELLGDPQNIGYLLVRHQVGYTMSHVLTPRYRLNRLLGEEDEGGDSSHLMSANDYRAYHARRIHILNDSVGVFKTRSAELSQERGCFCYFLFKKEGGTWLLDGINTCSKGDEGWKDRKLLGRSFPLTYYRAKKYKDKK